MSCRLHLKACLALLLIPVFLMPNLLSQEATDAEKQLRRVAGTWTLNPLDSEAPEPTPPPVYASYQKKDDPPLPALDTVPRINLNIEEGKLTGMGVLPSSLPMTDENRDVSGKEAVALEDITFENDQLQFKIKNGEEVFEATATLEGRSLKGTWKQGSKTGALYLHRRYR